ncbi:hypothetical protein MMC17_006550 [Xylographa soralifera]|nr:hypothetical protein [Xylographa soralifera]
MDSSTIQYNSAGALKETGAAAKERAYEERESQEKESSYAIQLRTAPSTRHIVLSPPSYQITVLLRDTQPSLESSLLPLVEASKHPLVIKDPKAKRAKDPELLIWHLTDTARPPKLEWAPKTTSSPVSFSLVSQWLKTCLDSHQACSWPTKSHSTLPDRVIDVASPTSRDPFLVIPSRKDIECDYLTLSHCWGGASVSKLLTSNIEAWQTRIPMESLPLTFRNAISITQKLGYQYLWIDSCCIIQDSVEDWKVQSAQMHKIYSGSVLTIGAAWGDSSAAGCFVDRNPLATFPLTISESSSSALSISQFLPPLPEKSLSLLSSGVLFTRAWVLQERILSPRSIYYGAKGLHWECRECNANEVWPAGCPKNLGGPVPHPEMMGLQRLFGNDISDQILKGMMINLHRSSSDPLNELSFLCSFYQIWIHLLTSYTKLRLTFASDTLAALSGLISLIAERTDLTSLHGHWTELLSLDLLWSNDGSRSCTKDPLEPSWSWVSMRTMQCGIRNPPVEALLSNQKLDLLASFCHLPSSNNSNSQHQRLRAHGPILHELLLPNVTLGLGVPNEPRVTKFASDLGWLICSNFRESQMPIKIHLDVKLEENTEVVRIVVIKWTQKKTATTEEREVHAGLVLKATRADETVSKDDNGDGIERAYKRIGYWEQLDYVNANGPKVRKMRWAGEDIKTMYLV